MQQVVRHDIIYPTSVGLAFLYLGLVSDSTEERISGKWQGRLIAKRGQSLIPQSAVHNPHGVGCRSLESVL